MKLKLRRSTIIPLLLIAYLAVMLRLGWPSYVAGATSPWLYFGGTFVTICCIVLLHFNLRRREQNRQKK